MSACNGGYMMDLNINIDDIVVDEFVDQKTWEQDNDLEIECVRLTNGFPKTIEEWFEGKPIQISKTPVYTKFWVSIYIALQDADRHWVTVDNTGAELFDDDFSINLKEFYDKKYLGKWED